MSGAKQIHLNTGTENPILYHFDEKGLAALFTMIKETVDQAFDEKMRLATEKPMDAEEVKKFLGYSHIKTVHKKTVEGTIPSHELEPGGHRFYFASEIVAKIKADKR